jgi:hypothetical protein
VTRQPSLSALADLLAVAILEHGPSPGTKLALWVGVRKTDVLCELHANPMFEHVGRGRGSKWKLTPEPLQAPWEPVGTESSADRMDDLAQRVRTLERRFAELDRRLEVELA